MLSCVPAFQHSLCCIIAVTFLAVNAARLFIPTTTLYPSIVETYHALIITVIIAPTSMLFVVFPWRSTMYPL